VAFVVEDDEAVKVVNVSVLGLMAEVLEASGVAHSVE